MVLCDSDLGPSKSSLCYSNCLFFQRGPAASTALEMEKEKDDNLIKTWSTLCFLLGQKIKSTNNLMTHFKNNTSK